MTAMGAETTVTNDETGVPWLVRLVEKGQRYGDDHLRHSEDEWMVEFYDLRFTEEFGPRGQFVARVYAEELWEEEEARGIDLDSGSPDRGLTAANIEAIRAWLDWIY